MRPLVITSFSLVILAFGSLGCNKNNDDTSSTTKSANAGGQIGEFPKMDDKSWVHGSPVSLDQTRGKQVVLIEAWHPT